MHNDNMFIRVTWHYTASQ